MANSPTGSAQKKCTCIASGAKVSVLSEKRHWPLVPLCPKQRHQRHIFEPVALPHSLVRLRSALRIPPAEDSRL
jgi:hypothetical protein